jgi:hypothetical protein
MANHHRSKATCLYAPPSAVAMIRMEDCRGREQAQKTPRRVRQSKRPSKLTYRQGMARARPHNYITDNHHLHAKFGSYRLKCSLLLPQPRTGRTKVRVSMERQLHIYRMCLWYNDTVFHKVYFFYTPFYAGCDVVLR